VRVRGGQHLQQAFELQLREISLAKLDVGRG
jgi:hypothetical protein